MRGGRTLAELHFVGHSGMYGPMFGSTAWPEQFSPHEWRTFPLPWAVGAEAYFHACRTGRWFAPFFARIFFRNAINTGLPVVEVDTDLMDDGDELEVDLEAGVVRDLTKGTEIPFPPLPPVMAQLLADGGLVEHFKKHGGFALD